MTVLVGLYSPYPQSGKGTMAKGMASVVPNTTLLKFADPMREVIIPFVAPFFEGGEAEARTWLEDERKDRALIPGLNVTLRHMLQTCGTEWGRKLVHPDLWVLQARFALRRARAAGSDLVIFDDLRLPNEYAMLRKEGGFLARIERPVPPDTKQHSSNAQLEHHDFDFHVCGESIEDLQAKSVVMAYQLGFL